MPRGRESLPTALSRFLFKRLQVDIPAAAWPVDDLPDHLKMRLAITDAKGKVVASGRDDRLLDQARERRPFRRGSGLKRKWERDGITGWDFGDLPEVLTADDRRGAPWRLYPRLAVAGERYLHRLFTDSKAADAAHSAGVAALLARQFADDLKHLKKNLKLPALLKRQVHYFGGMAAVEAQLFQCVTRELFAVNLLTGRIRRPRRKLIACGCTSAAGTCAMRSSPWSRPTTRSNAGSWKSSRNASPPRWWGSSCRPSRTNWPAWCPTILCRFTTGSASPIWFAT
jgi:hypothetical protein